VAIWVAYVSECHIIIRKEDRLTRRSWLINGRLMLGLLMAHAVLARGEVLPAESANLGPLAVVRADMVCRWSPSQPSREHAEKTRTGEAELASEALGALGTGELGLGRPPLIGDTRGGVGADGRTFRARDVGAGVGDSG
jgi:hypothetical protein